MSRSESGGGAGLLLTALPGIGGSQTGPSSDDKDPAIRTSSAHQTDKKVPKNLPGTASLPDLRMEIRSIPARSMSQPPPVSSWQTKRP